MIELGKQYQTRDGRAVRILCVDGPGGEPIIGVIEGEDGPDTWHADGVWFKQRGQGNRDLIPVPTKHEGWCLVPSGLNLDGFETRVSTAVWRRDEMVAHAESHPRLNEHVAHVTWED